MKKFLDTTMNNFLDQIFFLAARIFFSCNKNFFHTVRKKFLRQEKNGFVNISRKPLSVLENFSSEIKLSSGTHSGTRCFYLVTTAFVV